MLIKRPKSTFSNIPPPLVHSHFHFLKPPCLHLLSLDHTEHVLRTQLKSSISTQNPTCSVPPRGKKSELSLKDCVRNFHSNETAPFDRVGPKCISAGQQPPQFFNLPKLKVRFLCFSSTWGCFGNWQDRKFSLEVFQYSFFPPLRLMVGVFV